MVNLHQRPFPPKTPNFQNIIIEKEIFGVTATHTYLMDTNSCRRCLLKWGFRVTSILAAFLISSVFAGPVKVKGYDTTLRPFIRKYCIDCHGPLIFGGYGVGGIKQGMHVWNPKSVTPLTNLWFSMNRHLDEKQTKFSTSTNIVSEVFES